MTERETIIATIEKLGEANRLVEGLMLFPFTQENWRYTAIHGDLLLARDRLETMLGALDREVE